MASKLGSDIGVNWRNWPEAQKIRNIGEISLVMPSINEGYIRWTAPNYKNYLIIYYGRKVSMVNAFRALQERGLVEMVQSSGRTG